MDAAELDQLVAQIGDEILKRLSGQPAEDASSEPPRDLPAIDFAIAPLIDHTLLKPDATRQDILTLCQEARTYGFASVCVNACWVSTAVAELAGTPVKVCTVAGFPLGACSTPAKMAEAETAIRVGALEVDMVMNVGALLSGETDTVRLDIQGVASVCHAGGAILKVILETALLNDTQKATACLLAKEAGADFVKTSTGFAKSGATTHDVALLRAAVGPAMGVKASGGIRTLADLAAMKWAGANRIGASAGVRILQEAAGGRPVQGHAGY